MTGKEMIAELVSCYVPPPGKMQERMIAMADSIPEAARSEVIDQIAETETSSTKISLKHMVDACNVLQVGYHKAHYIPTEDWQCDVCGHTFKYHSAPSDDDKIDHNIHDVCPMCGFQVGWSKLANEYKKLGIATDWYDRLREDLSKAYGPKIKSHGKHLGPKGSGLTLSRGGLYWARSIAENERTDAKRIKIDAKLAEIDKAKRWELNSDREVV